MRCYFTMDHGSGRDTVRLHIMGLTLRLSVTEVQRLANELAHYLNVLRRMA